MRSTLLASSIILALLVTPNPADATPMFTATLSANTTGFADSLFTGAPDDQVQGLSTNYVIYDFGTFRIDNIAGVDLNVYEFDVFTSEFSLVDVLISSDGLIFTSIKSTETTAVVNIPGDESHGSTAFARSYDIGSSGVTDVRYVKLQGLGNGGTPCCLRQGFDLDGIGVHSATEVVRAVPEPSALHLVVTAAIGLIFVRRRQQY